MLRAILPPRVQHRGDDDRAAEMSRIPAEREQRVSGRAEEQCVDHPRIALGQGVEIVRQREDDMEVRNGQQVGLARREPPFLGQGLTFRAMAIATGVVGDSHGAAPVTRLPMPAEGGGATGLDGTQSGALHSREAMGELIARTVRAHDVGELHPTGR